MSEESEYGTKVRMLRIMRAVLERPYGYCILQLKSEPTRKIGQW